jgi:RNA polymerase sigma factor (TIGR02999 family)
VGINVWPQTVARSLGYALEMSHEPSSSDPAQQPYDAATPGYEVHYGELVRIARAELARHQRRGTIDTRVLVHEAWLRLQSADAAAYANRRHFYACAAKAMRHVVIDYARKRQAQRRNSGGEPIPLDRMIEQPIALDAQIERLVQMDSALEKLAAADPRLVQIIELRFFTGLEVTEVAEMLGVSEPTIKRGTRVAKAFLEKEMAAN